MPQDSVFHPGDTGVGQGAKAHREAMEELNPYKPPVTGTPAKGNEPDPGSAKNSSTLPKNWKRIPDAELSSMSKKLGEGSAKTYDQGGRVNVDDSNDYDPSAETSRVRKRQAREDKDAQDEADDKAKEANTSKDRPAVPASSPEMKGKSGATGGTNVPVKDKGGKINVNDGKHTLAILKDGERVLTPEQNKKFEKTAAGAAAKEGPTKITAKTAAGKSPVQESDMDCYDEGGTVHSPEERAHFHRAMSHLNTGGLHRHLGIDESKPIPLSKKKEAANSDNPHVAAMGRMAVSMHGWKHPGKK